MLERAVVGVVYQTDTASIQRVGKDFAGALSSLGKQASSLASGAIAAAAGIGAATLAYARQSDEAIKAARAVGLTVESYTALQFAAQRSGVSQSVLDTSIRAVQARLASVAQGSAEAAAAFDAYGVAVRNADGSLRTASDLVPDIADALAAIPDEGERAAAAVRLLGEQGGRMTGLLGGGAAALAQLTDEARLNGAVITTQSAEAAERLVDTWTDLTAVLGGFGRLLADAVTPGLADLLADLTAWLRASEGIARQGLDRVARGLGAALDFLNTPLGRVVGGVTALAGVIGAAGKAGTLLGALGPLGSALSGVGASLLGVAKVAALPLAIVAGVVLVLEDLYVAATGGDAAIIRLAEAFGVGAEVAQVLNGVLRLGVVAVDAWTTAAGELVTLLYEGTTAAASWGAALLDAAAVAFPPLRRLADLLGGIASLLGGGIKGFLGNAAAGAQILAGAAEASQAQGFANAGGGTAFGALLGSAAQREATGSGDFGALAASALGPTAAAAQAGAMGAQQVQVSIGSLTATDPRALAQAAADAVQAQVLAAAEQVGALG